MIWCAGPSQLQLWHPSLSSLCLATSNLHTVKHHVPRSDCSCITQQEALVQRAICPLFGSRKAMDMRLVKPFSATESNNIATDMAGTESEDTERADNQAGTTVGDDTASQTPRLATDVSQTESEMPQGNVSLSSMQSQSKKTPLTAREKLRAARVLSRYTEAKPPKRELGRNVLDALRESDKGKKRSGLPEAPSNMFDDSKRGMPKKGLTFDFPGGFDLFLIIFSAVFISSVMFATTYIVWKAGAIHFNEV